MSDTPVSHKRLRSSRGGTQTPSTPNARPLQSHETVGANNRSDSDAAGASERAGGERRRESTHFPTACVAYPAFFSSSDTKVSRPGTPYGQSIRITSGPTPVCEGYLPVMMVARVGEHSGCT